MKMYVIALRDIVADVYGQPSYTASIGAAIRGFGDETQRHEKDNMLAQHPEDFELWHIANYDDQTGEFEKIEKKQIAIGANYRKN